MPPLTVRLATPADLPRVDALRRAAYADAPWMPGIDVSSVETRHDGPGTVVFIVEADGGELLATTALKLVRSLPRLRQELDAPVGAELLAGGPVAVSQRSAAAPAARGLGLMPLLRWHYVSAARAAGAAAIASGHVGGTPNIPGLARLGWEFLPMGTRVIGSLGAGRATETWVAHLPAARFDSALALLRRDHPDVLAAARWAGPPAGPRLCWPQNDGCDRMRIGFVGLGVMGAPMAGHLARAGHTLALLDADPARTQSLAAELGAQAAATPAELARASDIVVTMLPDGPVVQQVVLGPQGLIEGLSPGALLLDCSSAEPWLTRETGARLAERGVAMVDAPVSGAAWGAQAAELVFMVGGELEPVARVRPLLEAMGKAVHHLGPPGSGHAMKCLNNCITAMTFAATTEALVAGQRYGLDPAVMVEVLNQSTGGSWVAQTHFDDPFRLALMLKDVGIALQLARDTATPMPMAGLGQQLWRMADLAAGPGASVSELVRWIEGLSGTELRPGAQPAG
jgi:3-hydroxyisobutyrate dehydrogenase